MADPHREQQEKTPRGRIRSWFAALGIRGKAFTILSGVLLLLTLITVIVLSVLTVQSLTRDDLALYLSTTPVTAAVDTGSFATITMTAGTKNLPFCTAHCTYTATDHLTGAIIAQGPLVLRTGIDITTTLPYTAPTTYERDGLVTVTLACANRQTNLCRSDGGTRYATSAVRVLTRYTPEQQESRDAFTNLWNEQQLLVASTAGSLAWLATLTDVRATTLALQAQNEQEALFSALNTAQAALNSEDYARAVQTIKELPGFETITAYDALRLQEERATTLAATLDRKARATHALTSFLSTQDTQILARVNTALTGAYTTFSTAPIPTTLSSLNTAQEQLARIDDENTERVEQELRIAQAVVAIDEALRCALYEPTNTNCALLRTQSPVTNQSFEELAERFTEYCVVANTTAQRFTSSRLVYAQTLLANETATLQDALTTYSVETITSDVNYTAWKNATLAALRSNLSTNNYSANNLVVSALTPAQILALNPQPRDIQNPFSCTPPIPLPQRTLLTSTLPQLQPHAATLPTLIPAPRQCCNNGICVACPGTQQTPIVFVHGFSFSQGTSPESNLNAFGILAHWLDTRETARYIGHVFPQQTITAGTFATAQGLPGRYSMTATYYYDSYSQDGTLSLISQKTENLETYAIRLREAIAVAKERTGEEKVVIVAHSMGGLVTRRYLQLFGEGDVAAFIMIGTPNNGITGRTDQFCGVVGSSLECRDMRAGSLFLNKLNAAPQPGIPVFTIAGTGCDMGGVDGDGIITAQSVALPWATNILVPGLCDGRAVLHSTLLDPSSHLDVAETVEGLLNRY